MITRKFTTAMRFVYSPLWFCLMLSVAFPLQAAEQVQGLYDVELAVKSQSRSERLRATSSALKTVFVRLSGNHSVLENSAVRTASREAEKFLKQFSYFEQSAEHPEQAQLMIKVEFEPTLIENLLREQGLPMWSPNRPSVLVWLVADDEQGRRFVGGGDQDIIAHIQAQAARRGLPVKMPSLDLQDTIAISPNELWQLNLWSAERAAARYKADSLLIGRMTKLSNGEWIGNWVFSNSGNRVKLESQSPQLAEYIGEAMDVVADELAQQYAIVPVKMAAAGVVMRLTGINTFTDYAKALNYLQQLAAVRHANPIQIEKSQMLVRLTADGELHQLEQAVALGKTLEKIPPMDVMTSAQYPVIHLNYRWPQQ